MYLQLLTDSSAREGASIRTITCSVVCGGTETCGLSGPTGAQCLTPEAAEMLHNNTTAVLKLSVEKLFRCSLAEIVLKNVQCNVLSNWFPAGGTQSWTGDLLICSQMLYDWAIPPMTSHVWRMDQWMDWWMDGYDPETYHSIINAH